MLFGERPGRRMVSYWKAYEKMEKKLYDKMSKKILNLIYLSCIQLITPIAFLDKRLEELKQLIEEAGEQY